MPHAARSCVGALRSAPRERLEDLSVTRPSLEEVYLELTADGDAA